MAGTYYKFLGSCGVDRGWQKLVRCGGPFDVCCMAAVHDDQHITGQTHQRLVYILVFNVIFDSN